MAGCITSEYKEILLGLLKAEVETAIVEAIIEAIPLCPPTTRAQEIQKQLPQKGKIIPEKGIPQTEPVKAAVPQALYIGTIYTETGHDYIGPDSDLKGVIADAKSVAENWESEYESPVTAIYVSPFNAETSETDSDADPLWIWHPPAPVTHQVIEGIQEDAAYLQELRNEALRASKTKFEGTDARKLIANLEKSIMMPELTKEDKSFLSNLLNKYKQEFSQNNYLTVTGSEEMAVKTIREKTIQQHYEDKENE